MLRPFVWIVRGGGLVRSGGGRGGITEVLIYPISMSRTHTYPSPSALFIADVNEMNVFADFVHDFSCTEKETIRSHTKLCTECY